MSTIQPYRVISVLRLEMLSFLTAVGDLMLRWCVCFKMETLLRCLDNGSAEFKAWLDDNVGEGGNLIVDTT
jgi:hypothetical protein